MVRVNTAILEVCELKWTRMDKFNSDDHYIYYWGQESLRRNGVALIVNERVRNVVLGCNLKNDRMISVHFQGKPFNIIVIQVYLLVWQSASFSWSMWDILVAECGIFVAAYGIFLWHVGSLTVPCGTVVAACGVVLIVAGRLFGSSCGIFFVVICGIFAATWDLLVAACRIFWSWHVWFFFWHVESL